MKMAIAALCFLFASAEAAFSMECAAVDAAEVETIRAALETVIADAPSARFKDVCLSDFGNSLNGKPKVVCGAINQKNEFGAYAGYRKFSYIVGRGKKIVTFNGIPDRTADPVSRANFLSYCVMCAHDTICESGQ